MRYLSLFRPLDVLAKRWQPLGRANAYVVEASEVLGGDEADCVGNIERVARHPDADASNVGDNLEAERAARRGPAALVQHFNADGPHHSRLTFRKFACCPCRQRSRITSDVAALDVFSPHGFALCWCAGCALGHCRASFRRLQIAVR
jgi:hypothetical protein